MATVNYNVEPKLPEFASSRVESFISDRMNAMWGGRHLLHGSTPSKNGVLLSSNDYLCISSEPSLLDAQARALQNTAEQLLMSPVFHDEGSKSRQLERALALYMGTGDAILCQSGWAANTGLLQTIANETTPVYLDHLAHMSLWYGAKAVGAPVFPFRHNNADHLEKLIRSKGPGVIAVDAIYSTNGDLCTLDEIASVADRTQCVLAVDESHSLGVYGTGGASVTQSMGLQQKVHFVTASLAKAFAGRAGLIGCPCGYRDYFMMNSYPTGFSSALLEHELVWLEGALEMLTASEGRRNHLRLMSLRIREQLREAGVPLEQGSEQIISLVGGREPETMLLRDALESAGVYGAVFCSPATSLRRTLVRLSINSSVSDEQAEHIVKGCTAAFKAIRG